MRSFLGGFIKELCRGLTLPGVMLTMIGLCLAGSAGCSASGPFEVGKPMSVVSREDGSGTRDSFVSLFDLREKTPGGGKRDRTTKEAIIANQTGIMMTNIAGNTHSIGYISLGSLKDTDMVKALAIDGVMASPATVKDGTYPIVRSFYIVTKGDPTGLAKDFIDYMLSAEGQAVVARGYISVDDHASTYGGDRPGGRIVVMGSTSVNPAMERLKEAYLARNTHVSSHDIEIQVTDSASGINSTLEGTCDIGMSSRALTESELEILKPTRIALDGIVVVVNKSNPIMSLTKDQVRSIFAGELLRWDEVLP